MQIDALISGLVGSRASFEGLLATAESTDAGVLICAFLHAVDGGALANSEGEQRVRTLFTRLCPNAAQMIDIGNKGALLQSAVLRNILTQVLPPELKGLIVRQPPAPEASLDPSIPQMSELKASGQSQRRDQPAHFSEVLILSLVEDTPTWRLLDSSGFIPLRCSTPAQLDKLLDGSNDICAFLVDASFLSALDGTQQSDLFQVLATYSTYSFIRIEEEGLRLGSVEVLKNISKARCETHGPVATHVSFRPTLPLQEKELELLVDARDRLQKGEARGLFVPGELKPFELRLLGAAMSQYSKERRFDEGAQLTEVVTEFMNGGTTGAKIVLVKVNDLRNPVVIKISSKNFVLDEARRFLTFVYNGNADLKPEVHLHGTSALIIFGVIASSSVATEQPAPTLGKLLTQSWYEEMRAAAERDPAELRRSFQEVTQRLARLNSQRCPATAFPCFANPYIKSVEAMESRGFDWGLGQDAVRARKRAVATIEPAKLAAISHGDAHVENVLIRSGQGFLIDYALSGPGHPAVDLVKLELSIFLTHFTQFSAEDEVIAFQRAVSLECAELATLKQRFPALLRSRTNIICLEMCLCARDAVAQVLLAHGLDWKHYIAVKLLSSWQALQIPRMQAAMARAIIVALT